MFLMLNFYVKLLKFIFNQFFLLDDFYFIDEQII